MSNRKKRNLVMDERSSQINSLIIANSWHLTDQWKMENMTSPFKEKEGGNVYAENQSK